MRILTRIERKENKTMINIRNFDAWKTEREKAIIEGGLKVLRGENQKGMPTVTIWRPKAKKPFANYYYQSTEDREKRIHEHIQDYQEEQKRKEQYKQERKGTPELLSKTNPGAIFRFSWGYDQTNLNFYQVISRKGSMVKIREIMQDSVKGSEGFMAENRIAVKDKFIEDAPVLTKKVQFTKEKPYITMASYGWCSLWDGKPNYCSWYA